jgi:hypothetical protein
MHESIELQDLAARIEELEQVVAANRGLRA